MRTPTPGPLIIALVVALAGAAMFATTSVTVADGDTLTSIAARHGVTTAELVEWNEIDDPDRIFVGDILLLAAPDADPSNPATRHVVSAGDTLWLIAARYGASVAAIAEQNQLDDVDLIRVGQVLTVGGAGTAPAPSPQPVEDTPAEHLVAPGETLFSIAKRHGVSVDALAASNGIADVDRIRSGDVLTIPSASETTPAENATPDTDATPATEETDAAAVLEEDESPTDTGVEAPAEPSEPETSEPDPGDTAEPRDAAAPEPQPAAPDTTVVPGRDAETSPAELAEAFTLWSISYGVDQDLLEAIAEYTTGWAPGTVGPDGRLGIAQLTRDQVDFVEQRLLGRDLDPLDTSDGVRLAARYLRYVQDRTTSEDEALRAFRQGLSSLRDDGATADAEAFALAVQNIRDQRR